MLQSQNLPQESKKLSEFKDEFDKLDKSEVEITIKELETLFKSLNISPSEQELQEMILLIDKEKSGKVDLPAIMNIISEKIKAESTEGEMMQAFKVFDPTGTGKVSTGELRWVMMNLGQGVESSDVQDFLDDADSEKTGFIKYEEFVKKLFEQKK